VNSNYNDEETAASSTAEEKKNKAKKRVKNKKVSGPAQVKADRGSAHQS